MTAEAARALQTARRHLSDARSIATLGIAYIAGREAYLAAEAYLHHRTGRIVKTHRGLRTETARSARTEPRIDADFARFLAEPAALVSMADAMANIETAVRLLDRIGEVVEAPRDVAP